MGIVKRSDKKSFYKPEGKESFLKMTGFTEISKTMNASEYTRKYVDCDFSESDVVGYSPSLTVAFDEHTKNEVHTDIREIFDKEKTGEDAVREVVTVDFTQPIEGSANTFKARMRKYAVIPSAEGSGTEHYAYSATFKSKSETVFGKAVSNDGFATVTFSKEE